jgi:hypothetical protein
VRIDTIYALILAIVFGQESAGYTSFSRIVEQPNERRSFMTSRKSFTMISTKPNIIWRLNFDLILKASRKN